jgi:hypothetical protein
VHISACKDEKLGRGDKDVLSDEAVVMEIMEPYFSKSYTLYISN